VSAVVDVVVVVVVVAGAGAFLLRRLFARPSRAAPVVVGPGLQKGLDRARRRRRGR
jgi:hypothetical protein